MLGMKNETAWPALLHGLSEAEALRALVLFSLVLAIVSCVYRSFSASAVTALRRSNGALAWVLIANVALLAVTFLWPDGARTTPFRTSAFRRSLVDGK